MTPMSYPRVYSQNGYWMVELERNKRKSLSSLGFDVKKGEDGRKRAELIEKELKERKFANVLTEMLNGKKHPVEAYVQDYLEIRRKTHPEKTYKADRLALSKLLDFCKNNNITFLQSILLKHLEALKADLMSTLKSTSVGVHLRHIKAFFNQAEKQEDIQKNPMRFLKMPKHGDPGTKFHTEEEIKNILEYCKDKPVFKYTVPLGYYLGISRNELCGEIKKINGMICYRRAKTRREMVVPISEALGEYLKDLPDGVHNLVPWHTDTYSHRYVELCKEAGVKSSTHMMRHSCASHIMQHGGNIKHVKELLGHSQLSTTERYGKIAMENLRDAVSKLA